MERSEISRTLLSMFLFTLFFYFPFIIGLIVVKGMSLSQALIIFYRDGSFTFLSIAFLGSFFSPYILNKSHLIQTKTSKVIAIMGFFIILILLIFFSPPISKNLNYVYGHNVILNLLFRLSILQIYCFYIKLHCTLKN